MIPGLSSLADTLQGLISRNFLLSGFYPVALFGFASLWPLHALYPDAWQFLTEHLESGELVSTEFSLLVIGLVVAAYVLWSLRAVFREVLEGRYLWASARDALEAQQTALWRSIEEKRKGLRLDRVALRRVAGMNPFEARNLEEDADPRTVEHAEKQWVNVLDAAIKQAGGVSGKRTGENDLGDLKVALQDLKGMQNRHERIPYALLDSCKDEIVKHCDPQTRATLSDDGDAVLQEAAQELPYLARYALANLERDYGRLSARLLFRFPNDHLTIAPTALGNMAEIQRAYANDRYGIDIDIVRPRLQKLIDEDAEFSSVLQATATYLDVNVMLTVMSLLYGLVWFWQMAAFGEHWYGFLAVIAGSAAATLLFYALAVRAYRRHGEVLRSAVDLFRFKLLEALHIPLPPNSTEEKVTWGKVMRQIVFGEGVEIDYYHGPDAGGELPEDDVEAEADAEADAEEPEGTVDAIVRELRELYERFRR